MMMTIVIIITIIVVIIVIIPSYVFEIWQMISDKYLCLKHSRKAKNMPTASAQNIMRACAVEL